MSLLIQPETISPSRIDYSYQQVRQALLNKEEIALFDVREEAQFAEAHPLFAANLPLAGIEKDLRRRVPRLNTLIVVYDNGEGLAEKAIDRIGALGYKNFHLLAHGLQGWKTAGGELFKDVNVPSKAFGELVESKRHTPMLSAEKVKSLIDAKADIVVVDARKYEEYHTMSIPSGISVPGAELLLRIKDLAPDPNTQVIVNCAGRTRSIIGAQSLINAGIPNKVFALRNGTIGWTLAGQELEHNQTRRFKATDDQTEKNAVTVSRELAIRAGAGITTLSQVDTWKGDDTRTTYLFDVRTPEEFKKGHLPGFQNAQGGQLVQETDHSAPVRGARIVVADDLYSRAFMTASWLAQMGWEVYVLDGVGKLDFTETDKGETVAPYTGARYRRPYEGTNNPAKAMQDYLEWEYGLVKQLERDGTHGFKVL